MKIYRQIYILIILSALSCTESRQTGTTPSKKPVTDTSNNPPAPQVIEPGDTDDGNDDDSDSDCDPDKDFAKLDFPDDIKDCQKDGKVYNFDAKRCTTMWSSTFECTYKGVRAILKDLELSDADLNEQEKAGLKLIGCGGSNNGFTIVTQHWDKAKNASKQDCSYDKQGKVVSICYKKYANGTLPSLVAGEDGKKAFVAECMKAQ